MASHAVARQPEGFAYAIRDIEIIQNMDVPQLAPPRGGEPISTGPRRFTEEEAAAHKDFLKTADSLDEIAEWIGVDPEALKETVDEYNNRRECSRVCQYHPLA